MKYRMLCLMFFNFFGIIFGFQEQLLNGQWNASNQNKSINLEATVPGGIYSDLQSANILDDIYYRFNDINYRWVANETWIYNYIFTADPKHFSNDYIDIIFDGLDTFSTIYLNNIKIGTTSNMFIKYVYNIKSYLQNGKNNLTIIFDSPIKEANKLHEYYAKNYVIPPFCVPDAYKGECHVNLIRKMQASFSWDWGPAFPSVGIWKSVYIRSYNSAVVQDVTVNITESIFDDSWNVTLTVYFQSNAIGKNISGLITTEIETNLNRIDTYTPVNGKIMTNGEYETNITVVIPKAYVNLWWPNGFGSQSLYKLSVTFKSDSDTGTSSKHLKIAFRKIELIQSQIDSGLTFYFKVNNVPIFAKGSNWIPANILPEKGSNINDIRFLLNSAKQTHMNMLRVWGGGVYESDTFYDVADELGILIWQDFMFACGMYPVNKEFIESVRTEVKQQVRRLQHHASIAVWAGNNENEVALRGNWYGTSSNFTQYKNDYVKLYVNVMKKECEQNDPTRVYLVSSPSNGLESEEEGYVAKDPYDTHYGDIHYYNYMADGWDQNTYKRARFSSEYGFQSMPSYDTLKSATNISDDLLLESNFLESREHLLGGYNLMKILINRHLTLPDPESENYFKTFIYFTQISQAMSYKAQTEYYRQWRSRIDENGDGLTMGALYWQLNDVWQAPSWSSIDFNHRWKMVHYFAKDFFAPILVSANLSPAHQLSIYTLSDLTRIVQNAIITMAVYRWDNFKPMHTENITINIMPNYSALIKQFWLDKYLENVGCGTIKSVRNNCFLYFTLKNQNGNTIGPNNYVFPGTLRNVNGLITPNFKVKVSQTLEKNIKLKKLNVTITTDRIAPFVWLDVDGIDGVFSENGFLQVTKYKTVQFDAIKPITPTKLQSHIRITSLKSQEHL